MKLKEILKDIKRYKKEFKDFDNWDVYIEIIRGKTSDLKKAGWKVIKDSESWEFINIEGGIGLNTKKKQILICANY